MDRRDAEIRPPEDDSETASVCFLSMSNRPTFSAKEVSFFILPPIVTIYLLLSKLNLQLRNSLLKVTN